MSKLTDLEICTRIADIEGVVIEHIHGTDVFVVDNEEGERTGYDEYMLYNPLTDDALCFRLMVKYKVSTCFVRPAGSYIENGVDFTFRGKPNKAICLAIIEASK